MEIKIYCINEEGSIKVDKENIIVNMDKNSNLYKRIIRELKIGLPVLSKFKNEGIPGKVKSYRAYRDHEDVLKLLQNLKKEFDIYYMFLIKNDNFYPRDIVKMEGRHLDNLLGEDSCIREFDDRFEYCIIKDYEEKYEKFECDSIQMEKVFV